MAFHKSSCNIDLVDGSLFATCTTCSGNKRRSEFHLDAHLGNANGFFEWGGVNFSKSAKDIVIDNRGSSTFLIAKLRTQHGSWRDAEVDISARIANMDGNLKYIGGDEPHIEHTQGFLGEERDFLSAAISDTISDLRELFTGNPLLSPPRSSQRHRDSQRERSGTSSQGDWFDDADDLHSSRSNTNMEDSTFSARTSVPDVKEDPPSYERSRRPYNFHSESSSDAAKNESAWLPREDAQSAKDKPVMVEKPTSNLREAQEHEEMIMQEIKEFLLSGDGHSVQSSKSCKGGRKFDLSENGRVTRTLHIQDRILFDQDECRRSSISETSDGDTSRCMTPSVVDGEDEYDFLN